MIPRLLVHFQFTKLFKVIISFFFYNFILKLFDAFRVFCVN